MSRVEKLEQTVERLSPDELATFRSWFIEFDAAEWDRQIAMDSEAGKLDGLAQSAGNPLRLTGLLGLLPEIATTHSRARRCAVCPGSG